MRPFDVEKRLERARIPVFYGPLPDGIHGLSYKESGLMVIVISDLLSRVEQRCALFHEYFHLALFNAETFGFKDAYADRLSGDKVETAVRRATAKALVPRGLLYRRLRQGASHHEIAEEMDVTVDVLEDAIELLIRRKA